MLTPDVLFEDSDILVIEKPAGFIVNRADTTVNQPTVQEWAEEILNIKYKRANRKEGSEFVKRGGVVHRLDKETSGILIIAKNEESFENLQRQFKESRVKKTYIALCHGEIKPPEGEVKIPIGRLPWNRMRFGVLQQGREARSKYKVLSIKYLPRTASVRGKYLILNTLYLLLASLPCGNTPNLILFHGRRPIGIFTSPSGGFISP